MQLEQRNRFIIENFEYCKKIVRISARRVHNKFSYIPTKDLAGYGFLGIINGLDKLDSDNLALIHNFLLRYTYLSILSGALQMAGVSRIRCKNFSKDDIPHCICCAPEEIKDYIEAQQFLNDIPDESYDGITNHQDHQYFLSSLWGSIEYYILYDIFHNMTAAIISKRHNIEVRKIRKYVVKLADCYHLSQNDLPYKNKLDHINLIPIKFTCSPNKVHHSRKKLAQRIAAYCQRVDTSLLLKRDARLYSLFILFPVVKHRFSIKKRKSPKKKNQTT